MKLYRRRGEVAEGHRDRLTILGNRAAIALKIFEFDKRPEIGEAAVAALRAVALNTPETDPSRAERLRNLGLGLRTLAAERDADARLLGEARDAFAVAADVTCAPTLVRMRAGREQARVRNPGVPTSTGTRTLQPRCRV